MSQPQDRLYSPTHYAKSEISSFTDDSETSTESDTCVLLPNPDGLYGWVIVLSSFGILLISDGIAFSFGLLYNALLDEYQASKSVTSWVGSIFYGVPLLCGPIASAVATKYGCRKATMFGGIVAAVGFLISSQAKSIGMLCFFFGIVGGFGMSMGYVTSVVMVAFYFTKKRALATGLAVCGSGVGTFLFAPLMEYIINEYGWRGALIILSGIVLNICVFGALYRPQEFTPEQKCRRTLVKKKSCSSSKTSLPSRHNSGMFSVAESIDNNASTVEHFSCSQIYLPTYTKDATVPESLFVSSRINGSNLQQMVHKYMIKINSNSEDSIAKTGDASMVTGSGKIAFDEHENGQIKSACNVNKNNGKVEENTFHSTEVWKRHHKKKSKLQVVEYLPMCRKDLFYRGNLNRIPSSYYRTTLPGSHYKATSCPGLFISTLDDDDDFSDEETKQCLKILHFSKRVTKVFRTMVDCSLFVNSLFMLYAVSNFILFFWYDVPYIFMTDQAIKNGISEGHATFIISILGVVNTIGQIIYGLIGDQPINLSLFYGLSIILAGLSVLLVPLFTDYVSQCALSAAFGLFISANYALSTVILVDFLSIDKLTNAYGLTMLMQGLANLIGPPVAGWLYDETQSYDATFYAGGAFIMFSGLMMVLVPIPQCTLRMCVSEQRKSARPVEATEHLPLALLVPEVETSV